MSRDTARIKGRRHRVSVSPYVGSICRACRTEIVDESLVFPGANKLARNLANSDPVAVSIVKTNEIILNTVRGFQSHFHEFPSAFCIFNTFFIIYTPNTFTFPQSLYK
jgi:hypothetical protein